MASNWEREVLRAAQPNPYKRPVLAGPWWLGFNDARGEYSYWNDYLSRTDRYEYQQGYIAGAEERLETIVDAAHERARAGC